MYLHISPQAFVEVDVVVRSVFMHIVMISIYTEESSTDWNANSNEEHKAAE